MDFLMNELVWLGAGVLLLLAELIIPGGIIVFLPAVSLDTKQSSSQIGSPCNSVSR